MIPKDELKSLRNEVSIERALKALGVPTKLSEGTLRFLCPRCAEFDTATNRRTNLGRCFRCRENFNPIDLVMVLERLSFLEAVERVKGLLAD